MGTQTQNRGKKVSVHLKLPADMVERLREISHATRIPMSLLVATILRPAIAPYLELPHYTRAKIPRAKIVTNTTVEKIAEGEGA